MPDRLGVLGIIGLLVMVAGFGIVTWVSPPIGAGLALIVVGTGLLVRSLIKNALSAFGMG